VQRRQVNVSHGYLPVLAGRYALQSRYPDPSPFHHTYLKLKLFGRFAIRRLNLHLDDSLYSRDSMRAVLRCMAFSAAEIRA
jgi:hypothetical protein